MTVGELIRELSRFNKDEEVFLYQPTHNYWHEVIAVNTDYVDYAVVGESGQIYDMQLDAYKNEDTPTSKVVIR